MIGFRWAPSCVSWSSDGSSVALGGYDDRKILICDLTCSITSDRIEFSRGVSLAGHSTRVTGIQWSPCGKYIASCSCDGVMFIRDAASYSLLHVLRGERSEGRVYWSPDSAFVAVKYSQLEIKAIHIWEVEKEKKVYTFEGHSEGITSILWPTPEQKVFSAISSQRMYSWNIADSELFVLTLKQVKVIKEIIARKSFSHFTQQEVNAYQTLSPRWKNILSERFADSSQRGASSV